MTTYVKLDKYIIDAFYKNKSVPSTYIYETSFVEEIQAIKKIDELTNDDECTKIEVYFSNLRGRTLIKKVDKS